uniref:Uncharacterized protein n=1 Tax=Brassica campestris TaxID=3711 RepID=M4DK30_BRACM
MTPNLRSLVAKAYRVRQGRTFSSSSSSAPNPIGDKGKGLDFMPLLDLASTISVWSLAGYVVQFGWEMSRMLKIKRRSDMDTERYEIELERFRERLAYRVCQGRAFCSSSSSAPNPIGDKGGNCIVRYLVSRGVIMMMGFGAGTYGSGDKVAKYEERMKAIDNDAWETLAMQQELLYLDMYES